ncbi:MAG: surface-adhesin E family protein [Steroidobacteraceae bacterium]
MIRLVIAALSLVAATAAAQINEVPLHGEGNDWVKQLELRGRLDWEWMRTYPSEVYFATRRESSRQGGVVTLWTRIEYRDLQELPNPHRSIASQDQWDCAGRRKANLLTVYYRQSNLVDSAGTSTANLTTWQVVEPGTLGELLLEFACSIEPG